MFTGIVQAQGTLRAIDRRGEDARMCVAAGALSLEDVRVGDSIAVNGVCLTATVVRADSFDVDISGETLQCTTLGELNVGASVNLEKALAIGDRLGGHLVTGHVDGVGRLRERHCDARSVVMRFGVPAALARYIAAKGSICVDGVSLTVNQVGSTTFDVNLIPHTLEVTTLGVLRVGDRVNLEVDLIARYLERLTAGREEPPSSGITQAWLARLGFVRTRDS
jgi:riboflavin synthase